MKKHMVIIALSILFITKSMASQFNHDIIFINCTNQDVQVFNPEAPYKFSLTEKRAFDGYSSPVSFTISAKTIIYKYKYPFTGFHNAYIDGKMTIAFSGGVNGNLYFKQTSRWREHEIISITSAPDNDKEIDGKSAIKTYPLSFSALDIGHATEYGNLRSELIILLQCESKAEGL